MVQMISNPFGITVFGSAVMRVEPDIASVQFGVFTVEQQAKDAFAKTQSAAQKIQAYVQKSGLDEIQASRVALTEAYKYVQGENRFEGYRASINFHVMLRDLNRVEELLVGVLDTGANRIDSVDFQTSRLRELRAEVRKRAIHAAREKAEVYCEAAGVQLGRVLHIEDVNPDQLSGRSEGHSTYEPQQHDVGLAGSIAVNGAVYIAFAIE